MQRTIQVEEAHRTNARRALEGFDARTQRLQNEVSNLGDPDLSVIAGLEAQLEGFAQQLARLEDEARTIGASVPVTALVDQFYVDVQAMGYGREDTTALIRRLPRRKTAK